MSKKKKTGSKQFTKSVGLSNYLVTTQVQGSTFRVKDKDGIEDPKASLKMLISSNNCQFGPKF